MIGPEKLEEITKHLCEDIDKADDIYALYTAEDRAKGAADILLYLELITKFGHSGMITRIDTAVMIAQAHIDGKELHNDSGCGNDRP